MGDGGWTAFPRSHDLESRSTRLIAAQDCGWIIEIRRQARKTRETLIEQLERLEREKAADESKMTRMTVDGGSGKYLQLCGRGCADVATH